LGKDILLPAFRMAETMITNSTITAAFPLVGVISEVIQLHSAMITAR